MPDRPRGPGNPEGRQTVKQIDEVFPRSLARPDKCIKKPPGPLGDLASRTRRGRQHVATRPNARREDTAVAERGSRGDYHNHISDAVGLSKGFWGVGGGGVGPKMVQKPRWERDSDVIVVLEITLTRRRRHTRIVRSGLITTLETGAASSIKLRYSDGSERPAAKV